MSDNEEKKPIILLASLSVIGLVAVYFVGAAIFGGEEASNTKKSVQQVTLVMPPPPPPPPPKIEEPPPPEIEEEVELPEPDPIPEEMPDVAESMDDAPAGEDLGLDAEGVAGSDGFGLRGRKGGRGLLSGLSSPEKVYAQSIAQRIQQFINEITEIRSAISRAIDLRVWVAPDGRATIKLADANDFSDDLSIALKQFDRTFDLPPPGMKQPILLKIQPR